MNPIVAAQQIRAAKIAREAAALAPRVAYSTKTGDAPRVERPELEQPAYVEEYCFVCSRPTDHVGEHDEFVARGVAEYEVSARCWYVIKTPLWDARPDLVQEARDEVDREVAAWLARCTA